MAWLYLSPVALFGGLVVLDLFFIYWEYQSKRSIWAVPKHWYLNQILLLLAYSCLIFMSNMSLGILLSSICVLVVAIIDTDLHIQ